MVLWRKWHTHTPETWKNGMKKRLHDFALSEGGEKLAISMGDFPQGFPDRICLSLRWSGAW